MRMTDQRGVITPRGSQWRIDQPQRFPTGVGLLYCRRTASRRTGPRPLRDAPGGACRGLTGAANHLSPSRVLGAGDDDEVPRAAVPSAAYPLCGTAVLDLPLAFSYTHRPRCRDAHAGGTLSVSRHIPQPDFVWEILKTYSRPYNAPIWSHTASARPAESRGAIDGRPHRRRRRRRAIEQLPVLRTLERFCVP